MGLFGGSSQSTSSSSNVLDFNPVFNIGDSNSASQEKSLDTAQTISPQLDDSTGVSASVGVGVGGQGSGGLATLEKGGQSQQPIQTATKSTGTMDNINPTYLVAGAGVLALVLFMKKKKKSK